MTIHTSIILIIIISSPMDWFAALRQDTDKTWASSQSPSLYSATSSHGMSSLQGSGCVCPVFLHSSAHLSLLQPLAERWDISRPPCLEDTNPATLQHFDGDQFKCSKLDIVKNNWNICVASRKIWQFYTFCCIFRHSALSFGLDIVYWRRKWNPRHN